MRPRDFVSETVLQELLYTGYVFAQHPEMPCCIVMTLTDQFMGDSRETSHCHNDVGPVDGTYNCHLPDMI